jgi:hypothetical protein
VQAQQLLAQVAQLSVGSETSLLLPSLPFCGTDKYIYIYTVLVCIVAISFATLGGPWRARLILGVIINVHIFETEIGINSYKLTYRFIHI